MKTRALLAIIRDYDTADIARPGLFEDGPGFRATKAIYGARGTTYEDI